MLRPGGLLAVGFSGAPKLREFGGITRHGFLLYENGALVEAAGAAGFASVRVIALKGRVTDGDFVLRAWR